MKKFKAFVGLLVVFFITLVIYQNREYFLAKQALSLSLGVETWHWTAKEIANVYYYAGCFVIGLIITGYMWLVSKMKARSAAKKLNTTINTHLQTIESLQTELDIYRKNPYLQKQTAEAENTESDESLAKEEGESIIELPGEMEPSKA